MTGEIKNINLVFSTPIWTFQIDNHSTVNEEILKYIKNLQSDKQKVCNQEITNVLTVNGVRFTLADGSWGLVRASSNKPSLVVVTESPVSDKIKTDIFRFIDDLLQKTGKIGEYDQKI